MKKNVFIFIIFVAVLIGILILFYNVQIKEAGERLELETSNIIKVWDGRTGENFVISRMDYITRIRAVVDDMSYLELVTSEEKEQAEGSSYNIKFEDEDGVVLTKISFAWPENTVVINDKTYRLLEEKKYLLYAYIADALYLYNYDKSVN